MASVPQKWFFYNLQQSIDDPYKAFSATVLDSATSRAQIAGTTCDTPLYSKPTLRRSIAPMTEWTAFSPADNHRLCAAEQSGETEPVAVGHDRLLFEVENFERLRPIYWQISYSTLVTGTHWVFSDSLTPIDSHWNELILKGFRNFLANLDEYRRALEQAQTGPDPAVMAPIVHHIDVEQGSLIAPQPLSLCVLFSPVNSCVYLFKADSTYVCSRQAATALLAGTTPRGVVAVLKPFDFAEYRQMYRLPARPSDDADYTPPEANNLIMVFHGVGQQLSNSYTRVNFVYAIDKLRVEILKATDTEEVHEHFPTDAEGGVHHLVLAVNWRAAFDAGQIPFLQDITVPSLPMLRQGFHDAMLDIPLYMQEDRRPAMLAAAAGEANRLYALVCKHHPSFARKGRTHLVGHSLGALITGDLLTQQPTKLTPENYDAAPFKFNTVNYFTTGSMLGVFLRLKGRTVVPRAEYENQRQKRAASGEDVGPDDPDTRPLGCFAVGNLYNISNQLDLLSFLLNCTVEGAENESVGALVGAEGLRLEADVLPSPTTKSPPASAPASAAASSSAGGEEQGTLSKLLSRFRSSDALNKLTEQQPVDSAVDPSEYPAEVTEVLQRMQALNENGQLDYKLPQSTSYILSHILKIFTAHFDYWSNKEIARFLAIECGRRPGKEHTLPIHRPKWVYKPEANCGKESEEEMKLEGDSGGEKRLDHGKDLDERSKLIEK